MQKWQNGSVNQTLLFHRILFAAEIILLILLYVRVTTTGPERKDAVSRTLLKCYLQCPPGSVLFVFVFVTSSDPQLTKNNPNNFIEMLPPVAPGLRPANFFQEKATLGICLWWSTPQLILDSASIRRVGNYKLCVNTGLLCKQRRHNDISKICNDEKAKVGTHQ